MWSVFLDQILVSIETRLTWMEFQFYLLTSESWAQSGMLLWECWKVHSSPGFTRHAWKIMLHICGSFCRKGGTLWWKKVLSWLVSSNFTFNLCPFSPDDLQLSSQARHEWMLPSLKSDGTCLNFFTSENLWFWRIYSVYMYICEMEKKRMKGQNCEVSVSETEPFRYQLLETLS